MKTEATAETTAEATTESTGDSASTDAVANLIAATTDTVTLTVWASEEDQDLTTKLIDDFKAQYPEITFDITLEAESEYFYFVGSGKTWREIL